MSNQKSKPTKPANHYLKYTGMVFQLFILLGIMLYLGQYLDEKVGTAKPYFTAFLPLLGLIAYFYRVYIDLIK